MNAIAYNNRLSVQRDSSSGTNATRAAADSQPFAAYLTTQLNNSTPDAETETPPPKMTLMEAAVASIFANVEETGARPEASGEALTLNEKAGVSGDGSALASLLMMLSGSGNMNAGMLSLMSGYGVDGINGLLGATSLSELAGMLNGQLSNTTGQTIVNQAMTRLGDPYSKSKRGTGDYVDCSYLAQWAYKQAGVNIPGTAAKQAQYCYENGFEISKSELKPGDLVFWTKHSATEGRWRNIHHVGIYAGNGKLVEAKNPQNGVEVDDLWGQEGSSGDWEIVMYARPR